MVTDRNAGPFRARRRRREPRGTSMRPRPEPWPRRRQRRRIMRREQPCDHERPHRPRCGTFKAQPPRRLPPRSCTKHACRSHRCFCTDASRSSNRTNLMHLRVAGQLQPHESKAATKFSSRNALQLEAHSWAAQPSKKYPGSRQGFGGRSEPLAKPQRPRGRSDCALGIGES